MAEKLHPPESVVESFLKFSFDPRGKEGQSGYCTPLQLDQFTHELKKYPGLKTIAEIGLNAGHSAEHFLTQCKELQLFVSFDINAYAYTALAAEYLKQKYKERFHFVAGDSIDTVPQLKKERPDLKFDLIYIDGMHHFSWVFADILHTQEMAHEKSLLWIDDFHYEGVSAAVKACESFGVIRLEEEFVSEDPEMGKRCWVQARFLF